MTPSTASAKGGPGSELRQFLREEVQRQGSQRAVAKSIGITEGRLGRVLRGEFSLSVMSCLRLSKVSGKAPAQILRAAGKGEVVDLISELYGIGEKQIIPAEVELIRRFRLLEPKSQQLVRSLIATLAPDPSAAKRRRGSSP